MEHQIGNAKLYCKTQGSCGIQIIEQLTKYLDLNTTGSVYRNQVNFKPLLKRLQDEKKLIYDPNVTPELQNELQSSMPAVAQRFVNQFFGMAMGDELKHPCGAILRSTKKSSYEKKHKKMINRLKKSGFQIGDDNDLHLQSNQYLRAKMKLDRAKRNADKYSRTTYLINAARDALNKM